jgi:bacillithiol biosynthesis cysteine-adding enzyme BshC
MSDHPLGEDVTRVLDELSEVVAGASFGPEVLTLVREAYAPDRTVASSFTALMEGLLAPFGVCVTEASNAVVKEASVGVLERALVDAAAHEELLAARTREIARSGYAGQVAVLEGATNVFHHGEHGRVRLYRDERGFSAPDEAVRFERDALLARLRAEPARFSPNVFLRPVVESAVFPTLAYVGGPGEISYFAQLSALFPAFAISPPVVYPRASATLVEPAMQRLLDKLGLGLDELSRPVHELVDELARRAMPPEVGHLVEELSRSVTDGYRRLIEVAGAVDPTLEEALASLRNQVLARIGDSEKKVVRQLKRKEEIAVGQLERVRANLRPDGVPQDRVLNLLPFLSRHGPRLLAEIAEAVRPEFP